jgi:hypothetical protein
VVEGQEAGVLGLVLKDVQQRRLADASQAADDHALLGRTARQAPHQHAELLELRVTAGERRWAGAGVWGVRVLDWVL